MFLILKNFCDIFSFEKCCFWTTKKHTIADCGSMPYTFNFKLFLSEEKMESLLEQQRRYHEERERLTDALVQVRNIVEGLSFYINLIVGNFLKNYFWTPPPGVPSPPAPPLLSILYLELTVDPHLNYSTTRGTTCNSSNDQYFKKSYSSNGSSSK